MNSHSSEKYIDIRDENGSGYLCPFTEDLLSGSDTHLLQNDCLEKDVAERYAGNINIVNRYL